MRNKTSLGFTVSEMIIVLTLLAILGTISFFSFTGYSRDARDAVRVTDLKNIESSLETHYFDKGGYPAPTSFQEIVYKGAMIWKQGTFGDTTFRSVRVLNSLPTDPSFNNEYSYSVLNDNAQFELVGVLEGESELSFNFNKANAVNKITAYAFTSGNYNGLLAKVSTGGTDYVLTVPSITTNNLDSLNIVDIINSKSLVYNNYTNIPITYKISKFEVNGDFNFTPNDLVIFSGSLLDLEEGFNQVSFLEKFQSAYAGSVIANNDYVLSNLGDININILLPSDKVRLLACDVINFKLKYDVDCDGLNYITTILEDLIDDSGIGDGSFSNILFNLPGDSISTIFRDETGGYWFGTDNGVAYYDGSNWAIFQVDNSGLISNEITSIDQSIDGNYWIGTTSGISELFADLVTWNTYTADDIGLKNDDVYYIFTSDDGAVWVGTTKGVATLSDGVWEQYTKKTDNLSTDRVKVIFEDSIGNVWFGSHEKGVDKMVFVSDGVYEDDLINYKHNNSGIPDHKMAYILEDDSNNIWFGSEGGIGILNSDQVTWRAAYDSSNSPTGLYSDYITYIYEDTSHNFWFGTDIGVGRLDSDLTTWTHYGKTDTITNKIKSDNIISIYEDDSGNILILGDEGMDTIIAGVVTPSNP